MSDSLDPRDELTERLAALGRHPVDAALQSQHLTAMAGVPAGGSAFRTSLAGRLKVAAGILGGFLLGASGLTAAGAMGPLQPIAAQVAHDVAKADVPQGPKDKAEKAAKEKAEKARLADGSIGTARDWSDNCADTGTAGEYAGNRGQYLKQERAKGEDALEAAKASTCGMPLAGDDADEADEPKVESEDEAKNDDAGKSDEDHGKATAPGQQDKDEPGDKAKGPKDEQGDDEGDETPAGPPAEAGKSGVTPPVVDPPAEPTPDTPAPAGDGEV